MKTSLYNKIEKEIVWEIKDRLPTIILGIEGTYKELKIFKKLPFIIYPCFIKYKKRKIIKEFEMFEKHLIPLNGFFSKKEKLKKKLKKIKKC